MYTVNLGMDKVNLTEAARILGISEGAVRKRHKRGKLRGETGVDGRLYVWVDVGETERPEASGDLVESLREEVEYLRGVVDRRDRELEAEREARIEERRRVDTVIAQLSQANAELSRTIRAIEAPADTERPPDGPESAEARSDRVETPREPDTGTQRRSLWGRLFGR